MSSKVKPWTFLAAQPCSHTSELEDEHVKANEATKTGVHSADFADQQERSICQSDIHFRKLCICQLDTPKKKNQEDNSQLDPCTELLQGRLHIPTSG